MLTMAEIKRWITETLEQSTDFTSTCTTIVGKQLNFYRSTPMDRAMESLPYLTAFSEKKEDNRMAGDEMGQNWTIPIVIAITADEDSKEDSNITVWDSSEKAEIIEAEMIKVLDKELSCGIMGNYSIRILAIDTVVTEIGEADDVQSISWIQFGQYRTL